MLYKRNAYLSQDAYMHTLEQEIEGIPIIDDLITTLTKAEKQRRPF
jgi:cell fate (sporulation/competence/biofilm development) regulator YmcA (YheA/YmcA/DUF963 family)